MINITSSIKMARFLQFLMAYSLKCLHKAEDADKY